jgi:hypothetical protein
LIGELDIEISHRGGHLGYSGQDVSQSLDIPWHLMPRIEAGAPFIGWVFGWTLIIIAAGMIIATWIWI